MVGKSRAVKLFCLLLLISIILCSIGEQQVYSEDASRKVSLQKQYSRSPLMTFGRRKNDLEGIRRYDDKGFALITSALLIGLIVILAYYLVKVSNMKRELQGRHKDLIESDKRLRQQLAELNSTQQRLVSSEMRYSMLFEKMLNGFCVFEPVINEKGELGDIRFVTSNPGFKLQTGIDNVDIEGKAWMEVYGYQNKNLNIYKEILLTGETKHFDTYYPGTDIYYSANGFKLSDNQVGVIFNNITEYKQAIKEITLLNEELEQRVEERTEELQGAVKELEAFTYTVSHDLKSPLRAIDGYSRILQEDFQPKLGDEGMEIIGNIRLICAEMIDMISKLLKYSITSKLDLVIEEINVEEKLMAVFKELKSANYGRDITLVFETELPLIKGDRVMLRQLIYNILSNAVKFTQNKEKAIITVGCFCNESEYVFYVRDNGAGFESDASDKLFGIFQRLHTRDEFDGSGIGLATVKKIIQRHGGRVWIEGKTDIGAAVYFTLPYSS